MALGNQNGRWLLGTHYITQFTGLCIQGSGNDGQMLAETCGQQLIVYMFNQPFRCLCQRHIVLFQLVTADYPANHKAQQNGNKCRGGTVAGDIGKVKQQVAAKDKVIADKVAT